jgi:hypothetical protein
MEAGRALQQPGPVEGVRVEPGEGRSRPVVERPAGEGRLGRLDEVEAHPSLVRTAHAGDVHAERARVRERDLAERTPRQDGDPGRLGAEPGEPHRDVQLGAGRPELERPRLLEAEPAGRRQPQHRLSEGDDAHQ